MKRSAFLLLTSLASLASLVTGACVPRADVRGAPGEDRADTGLRARLDAARELDQEGVQSFRAGRFNDAIAYFRSAYQFGGPPSELWNIVRCREGLDDAEGATAAIDDYLAVKGLTPQDRAEAEREAQGLRLRPSTLTVETIPPGALVTVDGKTAPRSTPIAIEIRAGSHSVVVQRDGYSPITQSVEARFGRVVIVSLDLDRAAK